MRIRIFTELSLRVAAVALPSAGLFLEATEKLSLLLLSLAPGFLILYDSG
jgi:hypothetical protein